MKDYNLVMQFIPIVKKCQKLIFLVEKRFYLGYNDDNKIFLISVSSKIRLETNDVYLY